MTETLAKQESETNDDEWIPAKAAGVCVMQLAQCSGDAIIEPILPFITKHFTNSDWFDFLSLIKKYLAEKNKRNIIKLNFSAFRHYREAAIMAFGSILEGPSKLKLENLIEQAIQPLIVTLTDSHVIIFNICAKICVFCVVSCKRYCGLGPWKGL